MFMFTNFAYIYFTTGIPLNISTAFPFTMKPCPVIALYHLCEISYVWAVGIQFHYGDDNVKL
jgi:hypothetical protein